jgi:hypothetical protein
MTSVSTDVWDGGAKVGAAFQGQARRFHSQLITDSLRSLSRMHQIRTDAEQLSDRRSKRRPRPMRPEALVEIEKACRLVPMAGCLRRSLQRDKKTLECANIWLIPMLSRAGEWGAGEEELSVTMLSDATGDAFTRRRFAALPCALV